MHFKSYLVTLLLKYSKFFVLQVCRFLRSEEKIASAREKKKSVKRPLHDKQLANMLANCWRQIKRVLVLANFFSNFFVLVNSYLTCERLANVSC